MFWDPYVIYYFVQTQSSFFFFFSLPSPNLKTIGFYAALVVASLGNKLHADYGHQLCLGQCQHCQDLKHGRCQWFPACFGSLPTKLQAFPFSQRLWGVKLCFNFWNKWNKSHFGSSWLLERYTSWPLPKSTWRLPDSRGYFSVSIDRNLLYISSESCGSLFFLKTLCDILW